MYETPDPSPTVLKILALALVIGAAASYGFVPERADNDVWWHLKTGQMVVEGRWRLPERDIFTYTAADVPWHNHEWLAQVLFYKIFQWGGGRDANLIGLRALILFKTAVLVATFFLVLVLVHERCRVWPVAALIALLALDVSRHTLYPRPPVLTFFLVAVFLWVLRNWTTDRWPRRSLLVLPPLTITWANLHGGFLAGLIVIFFHLAGQIAEHFLWWRGVPVEERPETARDLRWRLLWLSAILAASVLGSLATPYGYHLYALPARVLNATALVKTIGEMRSPLAPDVVRFFLSFVIMAALVVTALAAARLVGRNRPPAADLFLLAFFGYQALMHQRHLPLFAIVAAPVLGWAAGEILAAGGRTLQRRLAWIAGAAGLVLAVYGIGLRGLPGETYWSRNRTLAGGVTYIEANYPKTLSDFVLVNGFHGRVFNPVNCSGYLIFRLSPEPHQMFTDSRFDLFGDQFAWEEFVVKQGLVRPDSRETQALTQIDWMQVGLTDLHGGELAETLRRRTWDAVDWSALGITEAEGCAIRERLGSASWGEILERRNVNWIIAERPWPLRQWLRVLPNWALVFSWNKPGTQGRDGYDIYVRNVPANQELIARARSSFEQHVRGQ